MMCPAMLFTAMLRVYASRRSNQVPAQPTRCVCEWANQGLASDACMPKLLLNVGRCSDSQGALHFFNFRTLA